MSNKKVSKIRRPRKKKGSGKSSGSPPGGRKKNCQRKSYTFEQKLRAVKLYLEENVDKDFILSELGIHVASLYSWVKKYKENGEEGLKGRKKRIPSKSLPKQIKERVIQLKTFNPKFGVRRISQMLKRFSFLSVSRETVRKTLKEENLIEKPKRKPKRNPSKPRFFERAKPNQMWQTDIFSFRLAGKVAYLIGFVDDYSRYITGLELFYSQTAENVLEVYRRATAEYGPPKEMLTDNGRQYVNWRGTTKFEKEMKKDKIHHFRSRPKHPQTLGKIERLWKTIWTEFLDRAQFDSFESARERIRFWIQYYNHRRPHQGIGGLCPADRFFEIQHELRQVIEDGVKENVLELALRGKVNSPFYMVGRMNKQSVVMKAQKGKLIMTVNEDEVGTKTNEVVYNLNEKVENDEEERRKRIELHAEKAKTEEKPQIYGIREMPGSVVSVDRTPDSSGDLPGNVSNMGADQSLAEQSSGGYGESSGSEEQESGGETSSIERKVAEASGEKRVAESGRPAECEIGETFSQHSDQPEDKELTSEIEKEETDAEKLEKERGRDFKETCGNDIQSTLRPFDSGGSCEAVGGFPQNVLRVGSSRFGGNAEESGEQESWETAEENRSGEGSFESESSGPGEGAEGAGNKNENQAGPG